MTPTSPPLPLPTGHPYFYYHEGRLCAEKILLRTLVDQFDTPLYVYSQGALHANWQAYQHAVQGRDVLICYGMKANSNLAILQAFARLGAGFDIVSGGELQRVLAVGGDPTKTVFSGVGKKPWEIRAALEAKVHCFNVESEAELHLISHVTTAFNQEKGRNQKAPISLRVNPDVDAGVHPYIATGLKENKFGIAITAAPRLYQLAASLPGLKIKGVDCHIGSQITQITPYLDALEKLLDLVETLKKQGITLEHLDLGGGLGICYTNETPPSPKTLIDAVYDRLQARNLAYLQLILEPGRSLMGNTGVLLTTVQFLKTSETRNFAIVDAAMNDLLRPTLYNAWHGILPLQPRQGTTMHYDVVGPVCESGDWLAKDRPLTLEPGDVLALDTVGAYSMVMSSNYNTRPRPAEIMVDHDQYYCIRQRESIEDLLKQESMLPRGSC